MVRNHALAVMVCTGVLMAVSGCSSSGPAAPGESGIPAATTQILPASDVEGTLCEAMNALASVQGEHVGPLVDLLATLMVNTVGSQSPSTATEASEAKEHGAAIAKVVLDYAPALAALKSPTLAPVIVLAKNAYSGYGAGVTELQPFLDELPSTSGLFGGGVATGVQSMTAGKNLMIEAISQLAELDAAGSINCEVRGY